MKLSPQRLLVVALAAGFASSTTVEDCQAGPWLDSLLGRRPPAYPVGIPVPLNGQVAAYSPAGYAASPYVPPSYANLAGNQTLGYGNYNGNLPPTNSAPMLAPGFPQTVAGYLPTAGYDTQWSRNPVTYYRPVTAYDPRYGTTVTSLQPCTSYQYQAQRPPVIAPRPLLGEYGLQANRWPSITGPGYNPTGLTNTAMLPPMAMPYQSVPNAGMPIGNPAGPFAAPLAATGIGSGMPSSSMPLTTMQYNPPNGQQAYYGGQAYPVQNYFGPSLAASPVLTNPAYASSMPALGHSGATVGSGVVPSAAWMPANPGCVNGMCNQPMNSAPTGSPMQPPYIPGATSVTPVGPPTFSSTPNPGVGPQPYNPGNVPNPYPNPGYGQPGMNSPPVMPPQPFMPPLNGFPNGNPNSTLPGLSDPQSIQTPGLGRSASLGPSLGPLESSGSSGPSGPSNAFPLADNFTSRRSGSLDMQRLPDVQRLPMVAIDREPSTTTRRSDVLPNNSKETAMSPFTLGMANAAELSMNENSPTALTQKMLSQSPEIPQTLPATSGNSMRPLDAPDGFDGKPRWNPTLLDPDDRTVRDATTTKRNVIQLVSGSEVIKPSVPKKTVVSEPQFRPVTRLQ